MNTADVEEKKKKLRTGYTTGSSATAAAKAALLSIINHQKTENVDIILPKGAFIQIPIHSCEFESNKAKCSVIKDGGRYITDSLTKSPSIILSEIMRYALELDFFKSSKLS